MVVRTVAVAMLVASPAAAELLPLAHGTYVEAGTPCADPPLAMMRSYDGRGLPTPHSHDCRARQLSRRGGERTIANDCIGAGVGPAPRDIERLTIRVLSRTAFAIDGSRYRICPSSSLPPELRRRAAQ